MLMLQHWLANNKCLFIIAVFFGLLGAPEYTAHNQ